MSGLSSHPMRLTLLSMILILRPGLYDYDRNTTTYDHREQDSGLFRSEIERTPVLGFLQHPDRILEACDACLQVSHLVREDASSRVFVHEYAKKNIALRGEIPIEFPTMRPMTIEEFVPHRVTVVILTTLEVTLDVRRA